VGGGAKPAKPAKPPKHAAKGVAAAAPAGSYRIVGRLMVERGGKLKVHTPHGVVSLELTEQPTVSVDSADVTMAAKGDKISVRGLVMPTRTGPMVQAKEVKIELAEPLAGGKKKGPAAKSAAKHPAKSAKKDEGLPEPAADK